MNTYNYKLVYDPSSPSGLRWKRNGRVAGCLQKVKGIPKRWLVNFNGKYVRSHAIVMALHGKFPKDGEIIDHEDGDVSNNALTNLRFVQPVLNARNCKQRKDNSSGVCGVFFEKQRNRTYAVALWSDRGAGQKQYLKRFSVDDLGLLPAMKLAALRRQLEISKLGGYTTRHGQ